VQVLMLVVLAMLWLLPLVIPIVGLLVRVRASPALLPSPCAHPSCKMRSDLSDIS